METSPEHAGPHVSGLAFPCLYGVLQNESFHTIFFHQDLQQEGREAEYDVALDTIFQ